MAEPPDTPPPVPACDPGAAYQAHRAEIDAAVRGVLEGGWYILGREVAAFEREFAAYLGVGHAVGVASGTDGLQLALRACGIKPGDAVVTVSHTAVATVAAVELAGAVPVLADIAPDSFTIDPHSLEDVLAACARRPGLAGRVKAVIPVHLYGRPAAMGDIRAVAARHGLRVIEDCSQAHGAVLDGRKVGTLGDLGVFSLYPTKNLGAFGDAGVVVTGDGDLAGRLRLLREYGWRERYQSDLPGLNSRLDEIQAAVLRVRLRHLDAGNARRRALADLYDAALADTPLRPPPRAPRAPSVYHQYVVRCPDRAGYRDGLRDRLARAGVQTQVHYPAAVHQQKAYRDRLPLLTDLGRTERAVRQVLSLPMYPELADAAAHRVAAEVVRLSRDPDS